MIKALLVGIVPAMTAIAVHNLGDPFGGHVVVAMLWLYAGSILAAVRCVRADAGALPMSGQFARATRP